MYDVVVIGGGPAGLAAMAYALDKRLDALLIGTYIRVKAGAHQRVGGQQEPAALLGEEAVGECLHRIEMYPNRIVTDAVTEVRKEVSFFTVLSKQTQWQSHTVIVATGALPTLLGIPNERELVGHGLGYSSTTHARLADAGHVAVVGATPRALLGTVELLQTARRVVLVVPPSERLTSPLGQRLGNHPRVDVFEGYQVASVDADNGTIQAITVRQGDTEHRLPVQAVFAALRLAPNVRPVRSLAQLDANGFIVVDGHNQTSVPGLFAAGDVTSQAGEQIQIALGDGVKAARYAYTYILAQRVLLSTETLEQG